MSIVYKGSEATFCEFKNMFNKVFPIYNKSKNIRNSGHSYSEGAWYINCSMCKGMVSCTNYVDKGGGCSKD